MEDTRAEQKFALWGAISLLLAYGIAHSTMRLFATWNLGENDPVTVLKIQSLELLIASGFQPFDVLAFGVTQVFGENALAFQILRYGLLAIALVFVFLVSLRLSKSGMWALLTVEAYALIYQISWRFHEGFTYPLITMVAVAGTFWALYRTGRLFLNSALLLMFIALGLWSGFWFWVFLCALMAASFMTRSHTTRLNGIVLGMGGLVAIGLLSYMALHTAWPAYESVWSGVGNAALKSLAYLSPLLPIVALLFMPEFFQLAEGEEKESAVIRLTTLIVVGALLIAGGVMGIAPYSEHALMPVLFLAPIWFMDRIRRGFPSDRRLKLFTVLCLTLMVVAFASRAANFYVLDPVCKRCYFGIPFKGLAENLADRFEVTPGYRVVTPDPRIGGHIVAYWPSQNKPLVYGGSENLELADKPTPTIAVWPVRNNTEIAAYDPRVIAWLKQLGADDAEARHAMRHKQVIMVKWPHLWRETGYRSSRWVATRLYNDRR